MNWANKEKKDIGPHKQIKNHSDLPDRRFGLETYPKICGNDVGAPCSVARGYVHRVIDNDEHGRARTPGRISCIVIY